MKKRGSSIIIQTIILIVILFLINAISNRFYTFLDLTEDQRFTLTESTENLLREVDEVVLIDILLDGELPSGYKRLRNRAEEVIKQFRNVNGRVEYTFRDPSEGTPKEVNLVRENLAKDGIYPGNLIVMEDDKKVEKLIYPYAIVKYGPRRIPINLLEPQIKGENPELMLNKSENTLEYKFAKTIRTLITKGLPRVLLTTGNGELEPSQTATFETGMKSTINSSRIDLDTTYYIPDDIDALIVARPMKPFSDRTKFMIDQYIMNGGKVIWIVETLDVNVDSINVNGVYIPRPTNLGLDDMFFKYGVRIKQDLILDKVNSKIPQVIGQLGNKAQQELFPWVYYPLLESSNKHPIVNNIDRVYSNFPSTIESLLGREDLVHTDLLTSSRNSRFQAYPMRLSFETLKVEPRDEAYNKKHIPAAVLVEGQFESYYMNRVGEGMLKGLKDLGREFKEKSPQTSQVFITDAEIFKNLYDASTNRISPLGFNKWEPMVYNGNGEFAENLMDYLTDEYGLMEARTRNVQLRLLDQVMLSQSKLKWQLINILVPIFLVIILGLFWHVLRRKRYT